MPVCFGVGLVFGSGAVARYKSIIKLQFYLILLNTESFGIAIACGFVKSTLGCFDITSSGFMRILRVTWRKCFPTCSCSGSPNSRHLSICSKSKNKLICTLVPSASQLKDKHAPPPNAGWSSELLQLSSSSAADAVRLSQGQRLLFWITCRGEREGGIHSRGLRRDERGCGRESPCLQGGQGWMRVTTGMEAFAKSSLALTMWPVEGQDGKEIEVNNVVTY